MAEIHPNNCKMRQIHNVDFGVILVQAFAWNCAAWGKSMARIAVLFSVEYYDAIDHPLTGWDKVPFGLSIVAGCLERAGHEVRCWVVCPRTSLHRVAHEIVHEFGCDMAAASAVTTQFPLIARLCQHIKDLKPSIPILLGGVHATVRAEKCIAHPAIDAICVGEGEDAAVAWANAITNGEQPSGIPGLWIKVPGQTEVERNPPAPFRTDLDEFPFMNYRHWERWIDPRDRTLRVVVGRGCPYSCTYCSNHALRRVQAGRYVRFRSPSNVLAEIRMIVERYPDLESIYLEIETIGASVPWALQLCDALAEFNAARERPIAFRANLAVTNQLVQNEEQMHSLLSAFRRANLLTVNIGLESGSERIRTEILRRPTYTNVALIQFCDVARQYGISVVLYTLVGVPTETPAEAVETSKVARACDPLDVAKSIFYPYPGTKLHELSTEMHLLDEEHLAVTAERSRVYLKLKDFPRWNVFFEYVFMTWRVFHHRRKTTWLARRMISTAFKIAPGLLIASLHLREVLHPHRHVSSKVVPSRIA
ncbi:MAG: B12-binding domain-containing radical SAM protein [Acidobacteriota bacterium]|nr:B12-binding domain-containing radical SAM protein [Acidobacteriota bacterium]